MKAMKENENSTTDVKVVPNFVKEPGKSISDEQLEAAIEGQLTIPNFTSASTSWTTKNANDPDNKSRLSFTVEEKLHALTSNIRRRTSMVLELN